MNCDHVKEQLTKDITNYLQKIDILPLHQLQKIEICQLYVFSKLEWRFTIYHLNETWVNQNIDNQFPKHCKWVKLPVCDNMTHLSLPNKKLGMMLRQQSWFTMNVKLLFEESLGALETKKLVNYTKWQQWKCKFRQHCEQSF